MVVEIASVIRASTFYGVLAELTGTFYSNLLLSRKGYLGFLLWISVASGVNAFSVPIFDFGEQGPGPGLEAR